MSHFRLTGRMVELTNLISNLKVLKNVALLREAVPQDRQFILDGLKATPSEIVVSALENEYRGLRGELDLTHEKGQVDVIIRGGTDQRIPADTIERIAALNCATDVKIGDD